MVYPVIIDVQTRFQFSDNHICILEMAVIDIQKRRGYGFYVEDTCEKCSDMDPIKSNYSYFMGQFSVFDDRFLKNYNEKTTIVGKLPLQGYMIDYSWTTRAKQVDCLDFMKGLIEEHPNIKFFSCNNLVDIFLKQFSYESKGIIEYSNIEQFIMSRNVYNLCFPYFHGFNKYLHPKHLYFIEKRRCFRYCPQYISYAIYVLCFSQ